MQSISNYQEKISNHFELLALNKEPKNLYEPIQYILSLGGKRLRPVLTLMATEVFDVDCTKALSAATAVEVFHNFSLIHDDIMDDAPLRRGNETVHEKWNINTGILSGDAMLILAYQFFEDYEPQIFQELAKLFSKTALEVCEGQQYDVDFETRDDVTIPEYLKMIEYKTAVLVGAAMKMGAIVAETSEENKNLIYDFGLNLGIAFQLQDDYLDAFGNPETFGKQVGGDVLANKKTLLSIRAKKVADSTQLQTLAALEQVQDPLLKVEKTKELYIALGARHYCEEQMKAHHEKALAALSRIEIDGSKSELEELAEFLFARTH